MKIQKNKSIREIRFLLVVVIMLITYNWCGAQNFFQGMAPVDISNGGVMKPNWMVKGYFNNDKHLDFAVTNGGKDTVSVYLANSQGTGFLKPNEYSTRMSGMTKSGINPRFFTIAHFQSPDIIDLVTANFESKDISILLGDGNGGFKSASTYTVGPAPWSVAVGNFDRDARLDVAVANTGFDKSYNWDCTNFITILWNYENGTFAGISKVDVGDVPKSIIAADFDGNGKDDLAVASALSGTITMLTQATQGIATNFKTIQTINLGNKSAPFFIIYKENWKRLFIANYFKDSIEVYKNTNGIFNLDNTFQVGMGSYCIDFADFDGDTKEDMAVLNMSSDNVSILMGKGNGDFEPAVYYKVGTSPHSLIGGEFNGNNSKADLLVADFNNNRIIQINDNSFGPKNFANGDGPVFIATASLNEAGLYADKYLDLVTANEASNSVSILLGDGKGGFTHNIADINVGNMPKGLTIGSFDNNGKDDDVAVVTDNEVSILLNINSDGKLQKQSGINLNEKPTSLVAIDFNNNGMKQDLAIVALPYVYIWDVKKNKEIFKYDLGNTATGIKDMHSSIVAFNFGNARSLAITDCEKVTVLELKNKSLSMFEEKYLSTSVKTKPWFIANGDLDGDKKDDDLAVTDSIGNQIYILLYDKRSQHFNSPISVDVGKNPCFIAITDFNSDGKADLAVANNSSLNVSLLKGDGKGIFTPETTVESGRKPSSIVIGDFNKNGIPDMAVAYKFCFELLNKKNCSKPDFNLRCPGKIGFVTIYNQ